MATKETEVEQERSRYNSDVRDVPDLRDDAANTAKKLSADKSETRTTTSTEGEVEKTTQRTGDRG